MPRRAPWRERAELEVPPPPLLDDESDDANDDDRRGGGECGTRAAIRQAF